MEDRDIYSFGEYCIMLMDSDIFYVLTFPIMLVGFFILMVLALIGYPFYRLGRYLKRW